MEKKLLCLVLAFVFAVGLGLTARAEDLALPAPSCILMEKDTGQILYESNAHEKLRPASVTKIMTLLLVMEALDNGSIGWDDTVTTSAAAAAKGGSQIYLEENEQLPLREMLKSVVVSSANDCACALAEHVAGSEAAFVSRMNDRAAELGMTDTHFVNCTGLDDGPDADTHLTTAYDIALMSCELLKHDEIKEYTTIWMDTVRNGQFGLSNTNKLVRFYDGTTGLKTVLPLPPGIVCRPLLSVGEWNWSQSCCTAKPQLTGLNRPRRCSTTVFPTMPLLRRSRRAEFRLFRSYWGGRSLSRLFQNTARRFCWKRRLPRRYRLPLRLTRRYRRLWLPDSGSAR